MLIEIAVQSPQGAQTAKDNGADRVELCSALGIGGITPSAATIALTAEVGLPVQVLIRPRAGGYVYSPDEIALQAADIVQARQLGAAGVVVGALRPDNTIDLAALATFRDAAGRLPITFHRAFDVIPEPAEALEQLIGLGIVRVLTSGGAPRSIDGLETLAQLNKQAAGRIQIQAGGGVRVQDIAAFRAAGLPAVHLSAKAEVADAGASGPGGHGADSYEITDPRIVADAVSAAHS
jgi:copper homeostasis protein